MESLLMVATVWGGHSLMAAVPVVVAYVAAPSRLRWQRWEWAFFIVPFWLLVPAQMAYPVGGMSSFLIRLGLLTAILFVCLLIRSLFPANRKQSLISACLLASCCAAVAVLQVAVPALPD